MLCMFNGCSDGIIVEFKSTTQYRMNTKTNINLFILPWMFKKIFWKYSVVTSLERTAKRLCENCCYICQNAEL